MAEVARGRKRLQKVAKGLKRGCKEVAKGLHRGGKVVAKGL